jgi:hypothetical protein
MSKWHWGNSINWMLSIPNSTTCAAAVIQALDFRIAKLDELEPVPGVEGLLGGFSFAVFWIGFPMLQA